MMDEKAMKALFEKAHQTLRDLESSLIGAVENEIDEGRFTAKGGGVSAELQWPYFGYHHESKRDGPFLLRFYLEAKIDPPAPEESA